MIDLILNTNITFYIGAFVQWGFLMAFLYSLVSSINNADKSKVWLTSIMALSYSSSLFIDMDSITYFDFFLFDTATLASIALCGFFIKSCTLYIYLLIGLSINTSLFFAMYIDNDIMHHYEYWWFWDIYFVGVNFSDLLMITVSLLNKDILGLVKLSNYLTTKLKRFRYA
ncbi:MULTISPECIES: hypothetical protein [Pseudoalteromonas]|uniref:Uncharacterized protein n=1 Tax=Pseudoalteromonas agarivorans DSM 14585 TaxID=1312369 RepID=A0ACA8DYN8_9GAMM|nr:MULTISPECIES: hypothetical protein [Pseudoalteromonas]ATC83131.1 hypothetical protein PAGA_a2917 [Pseudoalteromonas agarivorans DSM 14585]MCK8132591.1 hypothetical protein [Pseudoalteromonas sp. 2CM28B]HAG40486.1 hypothetical protein [Pseudoalteromonas sp.]|tara:strand:+ start:7224 stop:7733 length:510 start_codon:yes stop_codon:yes gene_type:complete